jgi:hypothetical protein
MNLEDVLDPEYGLQQDEWSLSKPKFGDESQLEVIGWSGRTHRAKCYIVKCHKCAIDSELHGSGHFKTKKSHLVASRLPCFCPKSQKRTEHQYTVLCTRKLEAQAGSLRLGQRSCACSPHRQKNAYIHIVNPENPVAVKFGVTLHPETRIKQQNSKSSYKISQYAVYLFDSVESCKKAERDCKKQLECGILTKQEMPDGWSETTWFYNLEKITTIYEYNGGIKIE